MKGFGGSRVFISRRAFEMRACFRLVGEERERDAKEGLMSCLEMDEQMEDLTPSYFRSETW